MLNRTIRPLLIAGLLGALTVAAEAKPLTPAALESWLASYEAAWEGRDAKLVLPLFSNDALYRDMPYKEPRKGRAGIEEYWRTVTADHRDVQFESKVIAVNGNTGVAHWAAKFTLKSSGATIELDGVFVLEFDEKGQCTSLREWWHVRPT